MAQKNPLAEIFGFPIDNLSADADRYRSNKLCPYNNKVPSCTKDKANDPLGVCSVFDKITMPSPGKVDDFINVLQDKLDEKLDNNPPENHLLTDILSF